MTRQTLPILLLIALTACTGKAHKHDNNVKKDSITVQTDQDENIDTLEITRLFREKLRDKILDYYISNLAIIQKWKYRKNTYIILMRFIISNNRVNELTPDSSDMVRNDKLYVGMIDVSDTLKLFSVSEDVENQKIDCKHTLITNYPDSNSDSTNFYYSEMWEDYRSYPEFDFAKYQISNTEYAFGIRFNRHEPFASGAVDSNVLLLYKNEYNQSKKSYSLNCIFAQPMNLESCFYSYPGSDEMENEVGRRAYFEEVNSIVRILPKQTNGYYDLQLQSKACEGVTKHFSGKEKTSSKTTKKIINFHWDANTGSYQPPVN